MSDETKDPGQTAQSAAARAITRRDFETVIRRAAELSALDREDDHDQLSEEEVVRIGAELGLPAKYVRQALFELPEIQTEDDAGSDYFGAPVLTATRVVPGSAPDVLRRIEDYLTTREYLQVVRRRADR